jgi:MraZ protein
VRPREKVDRSGISGYPVSEIGFFSKWQQIRQSGQAEFSCFAAKTVTLDAKGRLAMPTRYREGLVEDAAGYLVPPIAERCLLLTPYLTGKKSNASLLLPALDPKAQSAALDDYYATDIELDAQGRVLIPPICANTPD